MKGLDHAQSSNLRSCLTQRKHSRGAIKSLQRSQTEGLSAYRAWSSNPVHSWLGISDEQIFSHCLLSSVGTITL